MLERKCGVFFGLTTVDIVSFVDSYPLPNEKIKTDRRLIFAGGPAANAAVAFSAFGNSGHLISFLGNHPMASVAAYDLKNHGVTVTDLDQESTNIPVISTVLVNSENGDRNIVYTDGAYSKKYDPNCINRKLDGCSTLLIDGHYLYEAVLLAEEANKNKIPVILDGGSWKDGLEVVLPYVDIAICSENFSPPLCESIDDILTYLLKQGIKKIAITRGARSVVMVENCVVNEVNVGLIDPVDTLGAGDIFHGAFCHYFLNNNFTASIKLAAETATESCRYYGAREWIYKQFQY